MQLKVKSMPAYICPMFGPVVGGSRGVSVSHLRSLYREGLLGDVSVKWQGRPCDRLSRNKAFIRHTHTHIHTAVQESGPNAQGMLSFVCLVMKDY